MRRVIPVLAATAGGLALLANFRTTPAGTTHALAGPAPTGSSETTTTVVTVPPSNTGSTPRSTTTAPSAQARRTITGSDVTNRYGDVQVRITVTGHHVDDVQALRLPSDRQRSAEISNYAAPRLRQEVLQAQSANIDTVSGATYTSASYIRSLQAALDAIG